MGRIQILDPKTAAQIAAGEVITRPAAVVKELVENALDAGARSITVEIEEGGRRRIRVVDDGGGMSPEEAPLSLERHATSKIRQEEDLLQITTLGFRGEALPSIAAVSRLELISRTPEASTGWRVVALAGEIKESSPWAAPPGTQVTVEDLFFNTPVRRKFLKSRETEQAYIVESFRHLALGYPEVHFLLKTPHKTLVAAPAPQSLLERAAALLGAEMAGHLLPCAGASGLVQVTGLISSPDFSLASSRWQLLLVNHRAVQDRLLPAVLKEVYQGLLPRGRHPVAIVLLTLPPAQVDVNVHPAKAEIRFQDPARLYPFLVSTLRQALSPLTGQSPSYTLTWQPSSPVLAQEAGSPLPVPPVEPGVPPPLPSEAAAGPAPVRPLLSRSWRFQDLLVIGQLDNTYILAQSPEGLVLIDQHAAHERVLYEFLQSRQEAVPRQPLLFPRVVEVSPRQADWLRDNLAVLAQAGLELEPFGGASFRLLSVSACLGQADLEAVVLETVEALCPLKSSSPAPQAVQEQARLVMACHGAIKAGERLSPEQIQTLLAQLDGLSVSSHCPHGRPLWRLIPYSDIRQSFRRPRG